MIFHLGKGFISLFVLFLALLFSIIASNAEGIDHPIGQGGVYVFTPDTIVVTEVDTVVVEDTIVSYYKVSLGGGLGENLLFGDLSLQNPGGYHLSIGADYIRERFFISSGLNFSSYSTEGYSAESKNTVINYRDTLFQFQQVVDGRLVTTTIPVRWAYLDTINVLLNVNNQYRCLNFPIAVGYIYDKGRWSFLNGVGLQAQFMLNSGGQNIVPFNNDMVLESEWLKRFNLALMFQQQTLYYLSDRWALGLKFSASYFPISIYKDGLLPTTKKLNLKAGLMINYIL